MRVNLLPQEFQPRRRGPLVMAIAALFILIVLPLGYYTFSLSTEITALAAEQQSWQERYNKVSHVANLISERDALVIQLAQAMTEIIASGQFFATDHLDELSSLLPKTITLSEITLGRETLSLRGTSNDYASMVEFAGAIAASPFFGEQPVLANLNKNRGEINFSLNVSVKVEVHR